MENRVRGAGHASHIVSPKDYKEQTIDGSEFSHLKDRLLRDENEPGYADGSLAITL